MVCVDEELLEEIKGVQWLQPYSICMHALNSSDG